MTRTPSHLVPRRQALDQRVRLAVPLLPAGLLGFGVLFQGLLLLHLVRTSWFGVDTVNWLTTRGPIPSQDVGLFHPYAGHWSTAPLLVFRLLFHLFGMASYLPYVAGVILVHLANVIVLYALLRAVGARPWPALVAAWLVLFFGFGADAFMVDASMNHAMAVLLGLVACLVMVREPVDRRSHATAAGLSLVAVMSSGTGLVMLALVVGVIFVRHGWRRCLWVAGPAVVAFAFWLALFGRSGGRADLGLDDVRLFPSFLWAGVSAATGRGLGLGDLGGALVCFAFMVVVVGRIGTPSLRSLAAVGSVVVFVELFLVTLANARLGSGVAGSGRYAYIVAVLLAPGIALLVQVLADSVRTLRDEGQLGGHAGLISTSAAIVVVVLLASYTRLGVDRERNEAAAGQGNAGVYRTWVYGSIMAVDAGERQLSFHDSFLGAAFGLFASPELRHRLPPGPHSPGTRLDAEAMWFVDVGTRTHGLFLPTRISAHGLFGEGAGHPGCTRLTTRGSDPVDIDVSSSGGTEIGVTSNATVVTTQLFRHYSPSSVRTWAVNPGQVYVATTAKHAIARVGLNATGVVTICHQ